MDIIVTLQFTYGDIFLSDPDLRYANGVRIPDKIRVDVDELHVMLFHNLVADFDAKKIEIFWCRVYKKGYYYKLEKDVDVLSLINYLKNEDLVDVYVIHQISEPIVVNDDVAATPPLLLLSNGDVASPFELDRGDLDEIPSGPVGIDASFEDIYKNKGVRYEGKLGGNDPYFDSLDPGSDISDEEEGDPVDDDEVVDPLPRTSSSKIYFDKTAKKGLHLTLPNLLPNTEHRWCVRHIWANWKQILAARFKTIIIMLEEIRCKVIERMNQMRDFSEKWITDVSLMAIEVLTDNGEYVAKCEVMFNGDMGFEIGDPPYTYVVNVKRKQYSCRSWQLKGIPCAHAIAAMHYKGWNVESFVDHRYQRKIYLKAYDKYIQPMTNINMWPRSTRPPIEPPEITPMPGRPGKNRKKSKDESVKKKFGKATRKGRKMTCFVCKYIGHNKKGCPTLKKDFSSSCGSQPSVVNYVLDIFLKLDIDSLENESSKSIRGLDHSLFRHNVLFEDSLFTPNEPSGTSDIDGMACLGSYSLYANPLWCDNIPPQDGNLFLKDESTLKGGECVVLKRNSQSGEDDHDFLITWETRNVIFLHTSGDGLEASEYMHKDTIAEVSLCDTFLYPLCVHDISTNDLKGMPNFKDDTLGESESGRNPCPWLLLPFDSGTILGEINLSVKSLVLDSILETLDAWEIEVTLVPTYCDAHHHFVGANATQFTTQQSTSGVGTQKKKTSTALKGGTNLAYKRPRQKNQSGNTERVLHSPTLISSAPTNINLGFKPNGLRWKGEAAVTQRQLQQQSNKRSKAKSSPTTQPTSSTQASKNQSTTSIQRTH
ncbi:hypothetical protein FXO37_15654 [Capsicum annuum]|nr:hypothetical protein FXO37_15654 [Capsicum annuum]